MLFRSVWPRVQCLAQRLQYAYSYLSQSAQFFLESIFLFLGGEGRGLVPTSFGSGLGRFLLLIPLVLPGVLAGAVPARLVVLLGVLVLRFHGGRNQRNQKKEP